MMEDYSSQSYRWQWARVIFNLDPQPETIPDKVERVRLFKRTSGNMDEYTVAPGGEWYGLYLRWDGYITVVSGQAELALGKKGSWSGGGVYHGWVFMKPGAVVELQRKSKKAFLVCSEEGILWKSFPPDAPPPAEL